MKGHGKDDAAAAADGRRAAAPPSLELPRPPPPSAAAPGEVAISAPGLRKQDSFALVEQIKKQARCLPPPTLSPPISPGRGGARGQAGQTAGRCWPSRYADYPP